MLSDKMLASNYLVARNAFLIFALVVGEGFFLIKNREEDLPSNCLQIEMKIESLLIGNTALIT